METPSLQSQTLLASYRALLLKGECLPGKSISSTRKHLLAYSKNPDFFNEETRKYHEQQLSYLDQSCSFRELTCHLDGSVRVMQEKGERWVQSAGAGYLVLEEGKRILSRSIALPVRYEETFWTNSHIAEYEALHHLLEDLLALENPSRIRLHLYTDSKALVDQLELVSRIRNPVQRNLHAQIRLKMKQFHSVELTHCPREENQLADSLAKEALSP